MTNLKTYLNVPFAEKDAAKALGARWDPAKKKWYAPADKEVSDFSKWHSAVNTKRPSEKKTKPEGITTYAKDKDFVAYNGELPPWD